MRFNRWLIIIISIILFINIAFVILWKYLQIDKQLVAYVQQIVEKSLGCDFNIGYFSLSDRQFFASDVELYDKDKLYRIYAEKIYIEYNLWYLLFLKNSPIELISAVRVYNPVVDVMVLGSSEPKEPRPPSDGVVDFLVDLTAIKYPDTYIFFSKIHIYDGKFNLLLDLPSFNYEKHIENIEIYIQNQDYSTNALVSIKDSLNATLDIEIEKQIGLSPTLKMNLSECSVDNMRIPGIGDINSHLQMELNYDEELELQIVLADTNMKFTLEAMKDMVAQVDTVLIVGSESYLTLLTYPITIENGEKYLLQTSSTTLTCSIGNPLDALKTEFMAQIRIEGLSIPASIVNPVNKVEVNVRGEGNYSQISTRARINSDVVQLSLPVSDDLTITEEAQGIQIDITSENVLKDTFDFRVNIDKALGTEIALNGKFDPYRQNGTLSLYANDLSYVLPTAKPAPTPTIEPIRDRETTATAGQRRGQRANRGTPRPEIVEVAPPKADNYIRLSLQTNLDFELGKKNIFILNPSDMQMKNIDMHYDKYILSGRHITLKTNMQFDMSKPIIQKNRQNPFQINAMAELTYDLYDEALQGELIVDLSKFQTSWHTKINHLNLTQISPTLPTYTINSELSANYNSQEIALALSATAGNLLIKDYFLVADTNIHYQKVADTLLLSLNIVDSFVNYTPLSSQIEATGSKANIRSEIFHINDEIFGDIYLEIPEIISMYLDDSWIEYMFTSSKNRPSLPSIATLPPMDIRLQADDLSINQLSQYVLSYTDARALSGTLSFDVGYDNVSKTIDPLFARITMADLLFDPIKPFTVDLQCKGDINRIDIDKISVAMDSLEIVTAGAIVDNLGQSVQATARFSADLKTIQDEFDVAGVVAGSISFAKVKDDMTAHITINTETISFQDKPLLRANIDVSQDTDKLQINQAEIFVGREFIQDQPKKQKKNTPPPPPRAVPPLIYMLVTGGLDYNLFTDTLYPITDSLHIAATGDPIAIVKEYTNLVSDGYSAFNMYGSLIFTEEGLQILKGRGELNNGTASIITQNEPLRNIRIIASITDNILNLEELQLSLGRGSLFIKNQITQTSDDIVISSINLGKFQIYTDRTGLQVYAPGFMPVGNTANLIIRGRQTPQAFIIGPLDEMHISAEVELYNANIIFPERTDNLLKMFDFVRSEIRSTEDNTTPEPLDLPFSLDLMARLSRNNRYVTYPMNLRLSEDCYAHVTFDGKEFVIQEMSIRAEEGSLELFGTFLDLDIAEVMLSRFEDVPNLNTSFYRKVADGSTITLSIYTDRVGGAKIMDRLKFELVSDNAEDTSIFDILAKLRYGRKFESSDEVGADLVKDEAIQILGVGVASAFLNQYLAPIENRVRRILRLDNMSINPGFVQNMVNQKVWENFALNESSIFSTNMLLNNMQVQMGRYINRNIFLEYELNFQEGTELAQNTDILLYHTVGIRYDLPWQLKVRYSYEFKPKLEENAHEIFLMRSFKF